MISDMRNRITIRKAEVSSDDIGNQIKTFSDYCKRWAAAVFRSGHEKDNAGKETAKETLEFTLRYDSKTKCITPVMYEILFSGRTYDITSVENKGMRNRTVIITAELRV